MSLSPLRKATVFWRRRLSASVELLKRSMAQIEAETIAGAGRFAQTELFEMSWDPPLPKDYKRARELLDELDCSELMKKTYGMLSQGERQKILIARARMTRPYLIILDEPCAGLDPGARDVFLDSLEQLARSSDSLCLILVTHHIEEIMPAFKNTLLLDQGRVLDTGPTEKIITPEQLEALYGRPLHITRHQDRYWPGVDPRLSVE